MKAKKTSNRPAGRSELNGLKSQHIEKRDASHNTTTKGSCRAPFVYVCSGCNKPIKKDKFLLKACDKYWHENCLRCDRCHSRLGELGSTLYHKSNMNLCRQDYLEMFGETGICSVCEKHICASEMVMRAKENVYHLECFACQLCNQRFCVGDRFYLCENKVVCQYDYEEHILPIQRSLLEQSLDRSCDTGVQVSGEGGGFNLESISSCVDSGFVIQDKIGVDANISELLISFEGEKPPDIEDNKSETEVETSNEKSSNKEDDEKKDDLDGAGVKLEA